MADGRSASIGLLTEFQVPKKGIVSKKGVVPEYRTFNRGNAAAIGLVPEYVPSKPRIVYSSGFEMGTVDEYTYEGWHNSSSMSIDATPANLHLIDGLGGSRCVLITYWAEIVLNRNDSRFLHFGYRSKTVPPTNYQFVQFKSAFGAEFTVRFETTGLVVLRRGSDSGTVVATSVAAIDYTQYHWIVIEMVVSNTVGLCTVKVDGVEVVTFSGDTKGTGSSELPWNQLRFQATGSIGMYIDDLIVSNDLMGEVQECCGVLHVPDGAGDSAEWTPLGGANWQNVDDPTSTATYVEASDPWLEDLYEMSNPVPIDSVVFVKTVSIASSQATQKAAHLLQVDGRTYKAEVDFAGGANAFLISSTYWTEDPGTHLQLTKSQIENLQVGLRT